MRALPLAAALFALGLSAAPGTASAQAAPAIVPPSDAALALARELGSVGGMGTAPSVGEVVNSISQRLLQTHLASRGPSCEPADPRCRGAAERLAREAAPGMLAAYREMRVKFLAYVIDDQLQPAEIASAAEAARSPGGSALIRLIAASSNPASFSPTLQQRLQALMVNRPVPSDTELAERFYDTTRDLPRARLVTPPAPYSGSSTTRKMP
jgi:hypothetical protein